MFYFRPQKIMRKLFISMISGYLLNTLWSWYNEESLHQCSSGLKFQLIRLVFVQLFLILIYRKKLISLHFYSKKSSALITLEKPANKKNIGFDHNLNKILYILHEKSDNFWSFKRNRPNDRNWTNRQFFKFWSRTCRKPVKSQKAESMKPHIPFESRIS